MKIAQYDKDTGKVLRWLDTSRLPYCLPPEDEHIEVSVDQWPLQVSGEWAVVEGNLIAWALSPAGLAEARAKKLQQLSNACRDQILSGFKCSTLGLEYVYPANPTDQANLLGSVLDSIISGSEPGWVTPFWCMAPNGVWGFQLHTAQQIQDVGAAAKLAVVTAVGTKVQLEYVVNQSSAAELDAIAWPT
jgi:hypothetical protein